MILISTQGHEKTKTPSLFFLAKFSIDVFGIEFCVTTRRFDIFNAILHRYVSELIPKTCYDDRCNHFDSSRNEVCLCSRSHSYR